MLEGNAHMRSAWWHTVEAASAQARGNAAVTHLRNVLQVVRVFVPAAQQEQRRDDEADDDLVRCSALNTATMQPLCYMCHNTQHRMQRWGVLQHS